MGLAKELVKIIVRNIDKYVLTNFYPNLLSRNSYIFNRNDYSIPRDVACTFIHATRTGGITFNSILSKITQEKKIKFHTGGHNPISILHGPDEVDYVTILRNPVDRVFSAYKKNVKDKKHPYHYLAIKGLNEYLNFCPEAKNLYCQTYSGFMDKEVDEFIYTKALNNLKKFKFILNFSNLKDEIKAFCKNFDYSVDNIPNCNPSEKKVISPEDVKKIEFYNYYDIKLFREIKKNFSNF